MRERGGGRGETEGKGEIQGGEGLESDGKESGRKKGGV